MSRIKLVPRHRYPFAAKLRVRVTDLNYGAHLGHDRLFGLLHEARLLLFDDLGVGELDLGDGVGLVIGDLGVNYLCEGFRGDELKVEIAAEEIRRAGFRLCHRVLCEERTIALAEMGFVGFDHRSHKPAALPAAFAARLGELQSGGKIRP